MNESEIVINQQGCKNICAEIKCKKVIVSSHEVRVGIHLYGGPLQPLQYYVKTVEIYKRPNLGILNKKFFSKLLFINKIFY